ncbi:MAG: DUF3472 domain-containing protein [Flavicella sp.]
MKTLTSFLLLLSYTTFMNAQDVFKNREADKTFNSSIENLILTPNESFFSPVGTLKAHQRDKTTGTIYNKYEYYDYIYNWKHVTDTIVFGLDIKTAGTLKLRLAMGVPSNQQGSIVQVHLGEQTKEFTLVETGSSSNYQEQVEVVFDAVTIGFYELKLQLKSLHTSGVEVGYLKEVILSGSAIANAESIMRRYRAKAVHAKWKSATENPIEISVHQLTIATKNQDFYQPITTPFGYTGSTWNKNTQTFGGYNFSLWSYGQNDPVPPFEQESHLIAVGPNLYFSGYGHEGTGVKPRGVNGYHPYKNIMTDTQVIAVRMQPGEKYNTYWSYYLDPIDGHWKLYGCGKKYNSTGEINYLNTGAFVEVPGAASNMRNGHRVCETRFKGWQRDTSGNWYPIHKMEGSSDMHQESFRDWKIEGNSFAMQMGGWGTLGIAKKTLTLGNPDPIPSYLQGEFLEELYAMPAQITEEKLETSSDSSLKLSFEITDLGNNASAKVFYGTQEGLTKEDKWENQKTISVSEGGNEFLLENLQSDTEYFYRIQIKSDKGEVWSFDTHKASTIPSNSQDLQVYYSFSNNLEDGSFYDRDLTTVGGISPVYTTDYEFNNSNAFAFPSVGTGYLEAPYKGIGANGARTVSAWFKTTTQGSRKAIVTWGVYQSYKMFSVMIHDNTVRIEGGNGSLRSVPSSLEDNTWHHVAVTYDPNDGAYLKDVKIYIDGTLVANQSDAQASHNSSLLEINTDVSTNNLRIGSAVYTNNNYYWLGDLDEVRVYTTALSPQEVAILYDDTTLGHSSTVNSNFSLYPTLVSEEINIETKQRIVVTVYSVFGKQIVSKELKKGKHRLDVGSFKQGSYLVKIVGKSGSKTLKIIKK